MRHIVMAMVLAAAPALGNAQGNDLDQAAEKARQAWFAHNTAALVAQSPRLLIQLPGAEPSVALGPDQAAALLSNFLSNRPGSGDGGPGSAGGGHRPRVCRAPEEIPRCRHPECADPGSPVGVSPKPGGWTLVEFRAVGVRAAFSMYSLDLPHMEVTSISPC